MYHLLQELHNDHIQRSLSIQRHKLQTKEYSKELSKKKRRLYVLFPLTHSFKIQSTHIYVMYRKQQQQQGKFSHEYQSSK
jgi:hypothetical protein